MSAPAWTIAVTGATGMIGRALVECLRRSATPVRIVAPTHHRDRVDAEHPLFSPADRELDAAALEGVDVVVHLAGESIADGWWTDAKRRRIDESRVEGTRMIARALSLREHLPRVFVQASAVGYYGDTGDLVVDESSPRGDGFWAGVCERWEHASEPAQRAGIRVVRFRFGHVLGDGGLLAALRTPVRLGLAGPFGSGDQFWSWIAIHDLVALILGAIADDTMHGTYNAVTPNPVRNRDFIELYAQHLGRRARLPLPKPVLRALMGRQKADEILLASQRVRPSRLIDHGVHLHYPLLPEALRAVVDEHAPLPFHRVPATAP